MNPNSDPSEAPESKAGSKPNAKDVLKSLPLPELEKALGSSPNGLSQVEAQKRLHPDLVSRDAQTVMDIAQEYGALGWKVNGAGGEGGSLAILCGPDSGKKRLMLREIEQESPLFKNIPIHLSRYGLRVWI